MIYCLLLSDFGCVNKFVYSFNCVNELNIIKFIICYEFFLVEVSRFFKKDYCGKINNVLYNFCYRYIVFVERRLK